MTPSTMKRILMPEPAPVAGAAGGAAAGATGAGATAVDPTGKWDAPEAARLPPPVHPGSRLDRRHRNGRLPPSDCRKRCRTSPWGSSQFPKSVATWKPRHIGCIALAVTRRGQCYGAFGKRSRPGTCQIASGQVSGPQVSRKAAPTGVGPMFRRRSAGDAASRVSTRSS